MVNRVKSAHAAKVPVNVIAAVTPTAPTKPASTLPVMPVVAFPVTLALRPHGNAMAQWPASISADQFNISGGGIVLSVISIWSGQLIIDGDNVVPPTQAIAGGQFNISGSARP